MSVFIYKPRSRDRVLNERGVADCVIVKHGNGCRHILGGYHLNWRTADPGEWWRDVGRELARHIVEWIGGIAWDECGEIHLVIPAGHMEAIRLMSVARDTALGDTTSNWMSVLVTEVRRPDLSPHRPVIEAVLAEQNVWNRASPVSRPDYWHTTKDENSATLWLGDDMIDRAGWPSSWGEPEISPPPLEEEGEGAVELDSDGLSCTLQDILSVPYQRYVGNDSALERCVKDDDVKRMWEEEARLEPEGSLTWERVVELGLGYQAWLKNLMKRLREERGGE